MAYRKPDGTVEPGGFDPGIDYRIKQLEGLHKTGCKRIAELEQALEIAIDNASTKQQVRDEFESAAVEAWKKENEILHDELLIANGLIKIRTNDLNRCYEENDTLKQKLAEAQANIDTFILSRRNVQE